MNTRKSHAIKRLQTLLQQAVTTGQITAAGIVDKTGLPKSYVYQCLRGETANLTTNTLEVLCAAIGVSPSELWDRTAAPASVQKAHELVGRYLKGK